LQIFSSSFASHFGGIDATGVGRVVRWARPEKLSDLRYQEASGKGDMAAGSRDPASSGGRVIDLRNAVAHRQLMETQAANPQKLREDEGQRRH
jgi:hypothetical protein